VCGAIHDGIITVAAVLILQENGMIVKTLLMRPHSDSGQCVGHRSCKPLLIARSKQKEMQIGHEIIAGVESVSIVPVLTVLGHVALGTRD
jgi:hypothetical protein